MAVVPAVLEDLQATQQADSSATTVQLIRRPAVPSSPPPLSQPLQPPLTKANPQPSHGVLRTPTHVLVPALPPEALPVAAPPARSRLPAHTTTKSSAQELEALLLRPSYRLKSSLHQPPSQPIRYESNRAITPHSHGARAECSPAQSQDHQAHSPLERQTPRTTSQPVLHDPYKSIPNPPSPSPAPPTVLPSLALSR